MATKQNNKSLDRAAGDVVLSSASAVKVAQRFEIGDKVHAVAFTDCFGKFHPQVDGLRVTNVNRVAYEDRVYFRLTAQSDDSALTPVTAGASAPLRYMRHSVKIEGAETFFAKAVL